MYDNLPQQETINQYTADGSTTVYNYTYLILLNTDIAVYVTASGATPNPNTDIKILNVDYTVTGVGTTSGGTVVFTTAPASGSTITLLRNMQISINTDFAAPQTLNGQNLDNAFERVVMIEQELQTQYQFNTIKYPANSQLGTDPTIPQKTLMAIPENNGDIWVWNGTEWTIVNIASGGGESPDVALLRAQLASEVSGSDGTRIIGYNNGTPMTLHDELVALDAAISVPLQIQVLAKGQVNATEAGMGAIQVSVPSITTGSDLPLIASVNQYDETVYTGAVASITTGVGFSILLNTPIVEGEPPVFNYLVLRFV